jgi:hypothetical protein
MSDGPPEQLKRFVFSSKYNLRGEPEEEKLEVIIPEVPHFSLFVLFSITPCMIILLSVVAASPSQLFVLHLAVCTRPRLVPVGESQGTGGKTHIRNRIWNSVAWNRRGEVWSKGNPQRLCYSPQITSPHQEKLPAEQFGCEQTHPNSRLDLGVIFEQLGLSRSTRPDSGV